MDREQARNKIRGRLEDYLRQQGIDTRKLFRCLNPDHPDTKPSMSYDRRRNKCHCFACGADYDTLDLVGIDYGLSDPKDIFEKAHELFSLEVDPWKGKTGTAPEGPAGASSAPAADYVDYYRERMAHIGDCDYLGRRGISPETAARFMLGYDPAWRSPKAPPAVPTTPRLIIPVTKNCYAARYTGEGEVKDSRGNDLKQMAVGQKLFYIPHREEWGNPDGIIFITEGEIDALSIFEAGGEAASIRSASNWRSLLRYIEKHGKPRAQIVLALDNDGTGRGRTEDLKKELDRLEISYTIEAGKRDEKAPNLYGTAKDANEALTADRDALKRAIAEAKERAAAEAQAIKEAEKEEYLKTTAASRLDEFWKKIREDSANESFFPTGFSTLDNVLEGGLYPGLYIVGAISSLGKTMFCLQICDQMAAAGHDVLIFSLEMSRDELMARSISRQTYIKSLEKKDTGTAKTTLGVMVGNRWKNYNRNDLATLEDAKDIYKKFAHHVFIHEGVGDIGVNKIKEEVEKHIRVTGRKPVVFVDYLQIMAPFKDGKMQSDKQKTDDNMLELKRLTRNLSLPILAISSLNRENYTEPMNMAAFKESGAIEYSSDVLIGLQYKGMDYVKGEKAADRTKRINDLLDQARLDGAEGKEQDIQIKVMKNRNGRKGSVYAKMVAKFNYFKESKGGGVLEETSREGAFYQQTIAQMMKEQEQGAWEKLSEDEELPFD